MIVHNKEGLKNALKKGEKCIEVQGSYAEELMRKYNQYIMSKPETIVPIITGPIYVPLFPLMKPWWVEMLRVYEVECYTKGKLVLKRYIVQAK